ncbi:GNAT family protein [Amnibacterium sp. CER49]|uniref:GNAT family N-acetyltransferase n=1 Tax=Amnibacterium sp. CER49 TaxID=3039161 RepID=UPI00244AAF7C|nr:GNAT family protein [Amnibacterium sp. CER49]MDH2444184.1 GNAT family protein [Amnibacterium sp. CER49]
MPIPTLASGAIAIRPIRLRDARAVERELVEGRSWLREWEATSPRGSVGFDTRSSIRALQQNARNGQGLPFVIEVDGQVAGQLNVTSISYGSLSSATIGYWIAERFAGRGATPTAVALATDHCFQALGLHRMEICIRPENAKSLRVVEKLGFRYEGLRRRYIHINGAWRDHFCFALVTEEVPQGVLRRWREGSVPVDAAAVPESDQELARSRFP